jgi:hypothetical protein
VNRIIHHQGGRDQRGTRVRARPPDDLVQLAKFAGNYWSDELETRYTFFLKEGKLFGRHLRHGEFALARRTGDRFGTRLWFMPTVEFVRDAAGEISGAKLGGGRVLGVKFTRLAPAE